ncbi:hypothetical protein OG547_30125 [Streptomyces longwoodensis]|uniref:hypothetical protein n=1 Tax=Streptomyces longwoodensis TaxID=68231 RepID=UPI002ED442F1|nr:hypothetical protein OG547_30125 [Streptomyces longwoodensis]
MSANLKRVLALAFSLLLSLVSGVAWGFIRYGAGTPGRECVGPAGAAFGGTLVLCVAVIMLFPFREDGDQSGPMPPPKVETPAK